MSTHRFVLAGLLALAAGGCASQKKGASLEQVDALVTAIERVHTGSELAQEKLHAALLSLRELVALEFGNDVVAAYAAAATAVEAAGKQRTAFEGEVKKMTALADPVFKRWAADLDTFTSLEMRLRSQNRLAQTRERYEAVAATAEPAQVAYAGLQKQLEDCLVFLKHDLNAGSLAMLRADVSGIGTALQNLDAQMLACQSAARDYVEAVALPSVAEQPVAEPEPAPAAKPAGASRTGTTTKPAAPRTGG